MKDKNKFHSKSEKSLYGIYLLTLERKSPITVEDLSVKLWEIYNTEFCMKGYPQFPNVDIQKHLTILFRKNLVRGGVVDYKITDKGLTLVENVIKSNLNKEEDFSKTDVSMSRELKEEIDRILDSKVYNYYLAEKDPTFIEVDFFEFLGTSSRSLHDKRNSHFQSRVNLIKEDLIKYCLNNKDKNIKLKKILELWDILNKQFGGILV